MKIPFLSPLFNKIKAAREASKPSYITISKDQLVKAGLFTKEELGISSFQTLVAVPDIEQPSYVDISKYTDFYGPDHTNTLDHLPNYPISEEDRPVYEEVVFERGKTPLITKPIMTYRFGAEHREKFPDGTTSSLQNMSVTLFEMEDNPDLLYVFHCTQSKRVEEEWKIRAGMANISFINPRKNETSRLQCEAIIKTVLEIINDVKQVANNIQENPSCSRLTADKANNQTTDLNQNHLDKEDITTKKDINSAEPAHQSSHAQKGPDNKVSNTPSPS